MEYAGLIPSRIIHIENKEYLFFSGTSYLGMHARQEFGELVKRGLEIYGTNYGASRLGNVSIPIFQEAEDKIAKWLNGPSALLVSSGTLAGRLVLEVLSEYQQHYAPNAHVAINPNYKKHQPHLFDSWIIETIQTIQKSATKKHLISFNSVDALSASKPDLHWIDHLPEDKEIILLADDSHGIGVIGEEGKGIYPELVKKHALTIMIASMGKAMGLPAGVIVGPEDIIGQAKWHPLFGGSSPMLPAYAYAYVHASKIYSNAYHQLRNNLKYFKDSITKDSIFQFTEGLPIFCTTQHKLANYLEKKQIRISHFAYPSPSDPLYTRIIINGLHTQSDLDILIDALYTFQKNI